MKKFTKYTFGPDIPGFGIFGQEIVFNYSGNGLAIVTQVAKALQQARRLGRFTNIQAAIFPVTPGPEFESLYENVKKGKETLRELKSGKNNKPQRSNGDLSSKTRASRLGVKTVYVRRGRASIHKSWNSFFRSLRHLGRGSA